MKCESASFVSECSAVKYGLSMTLLGQWGHLTTTHWLLFPLVLWMYTVMCVVDYWTLRNFFLSAVIY